MIIFDLDGTLYDHRARLAATHGNVDKVDVDWTKYHSLAALDKPVAGMTAVFWAMRTRPGTKVEFWTGRDDTFRKETEAWITDHLFGGNQMWGLPGSLLWTPLKMRPAGDHTPGALLKLRWLKSCTERIELVFEDSPELVKMFTSQGITCLQVHPSC